MKSINKLKGYLELIKPGIVMGNLVTCFGGFALASRHHLEWGYLLITLLGLSFIVASGCVSNNYIDRLHDSKMERTKNRTLPRGLISPYYALVYAGILLICGIVILGLWVNFLALFTALIGFIIYLFFYSIFKYQTVHATLIGSLAGAVPPVVGYVAVKNQLDLGAGILFLMIALWQMPHFYAIAMYRLDEYKQAHIPVLPAIRGMKATRVQMLLYIVGFITVSLWLNVGELYLFVTATLGLGWLGLGLYGVKSMSHKKWARKMFIYSLVVVMGICVVIPLNYYTIS